MTKAELVDTVSVPPKKVPFFKAGKEMREMVDGKI